MPPKQHRKLGTTEKVIWLIDKELSFNFLTYGQLSGNIMGSHLRNALEIVQSRHPLLRARIVKKYFFSAYFEFTDVPSIPIRMVSLPENEWVHEAEVELRKPFLQEQGPLCRCVIIRHDDATQTLMLIFHHAIGDAMSGVHMFRDVMYTLSRLAGHKDRFYVPLPVLQSMESYFPSWSKGFTGMFKHLNFLFYLLMKRLCSGKPYVPEQTQWVPPIQRAAFIIHRSLPADTVNKLIRLARKKETTIHGVLSAAYIISLAEEGKIEKTRSFCLGTDINLREHLEPAVGEDIGFFISGIVTLHCASPLTGFWDLARAIRLSINDRVLKGDHLTGIQPTIRFTHIILGLLGTGKFASRIYANVIDRANPGMIVLSNIGDVSFNEEFEPFKVHTLGFASSFSSTSTLGLHVATFNGTATMNFVAMQPLHSKETLEKIADIMISILKKQANES